MKAVFSNFQLEDYPLVCDFLKELNREDRTHIHWNWARWEWMYHHPYCNRDLAHSIGLWKADGKVVGAAIYDLYHGEAFCGALRCCDDLMMQILRYAYDSLRDENGLGVPVNDEDEAMKALLLREGFQKDSQTETVLCRTLEKTMAYELPEGLSIREVQLPRDMAAYLTVIWKGFDHEGDMEEWERMCSYQGPLHPNRLPQLTLSVADAAGTQLAHCTCWYDADTDYAYVEPVCTVPAYRGKGLGKAVVAEALNRCAALGAKTAYVISDQEFYRKLGFKECAHYTFYWKR